MMKFFLHARLVGALNGYGYRIPLCSFGCSWFYHSWYLLYQLFHICCIKILSHLNNESCSFKHIFLFLTTSWTILLHAVVNLAGSGNLRCEILVKLNTFCYQKKKKKKKNLNTFLLTVRRMLSVFFFFL